ncbi:MAG TPA: glycosyltransferase [Frankiaceae bacterium]|nr:glycosyltransferase [Frankiaceae bacterium]
MRLLFFGTYDVARHPRVGILMDGCRAAGDEVFECNVPLGFDTASRVRMLKRPWLLLGLLWRVLRTWLALWRQGRRLGTYDAVVVGYLGHLDVHLARRLWPTTPIVLDYFISLSDTAADRAAGGGVVRRLLVAVDRAAARAADVVVVDTAAQEATVLAKPRRETVVVPVGSPSWWFRAPVTLPPAPLKVVFFGLFTPLQGAPVIGRAVGLLADEPGITFTMIGGGQDLAATRAACAGNPRVEWVSWVDGDALPDVVASHHVCLGIVGTGPKALRVVPNKVYQGAAAGCAIVTSDTPPQRAALGDAAVYVPPGSAEAVADALRALAADPARVAALRQAAYEVADRSFRPEHVVLPLRECLR